MQSNWVQLCLHWLLRAISFIKYFLLICWNGRSQLLAYLDFSKGRVVAMVMICTFTTTATSLMKTSWLHDIHSVQCNSLCCYEHKSLMPPYIECRLQEWMTSMWWRKYWWLILMPCDTLSFLLSTSRNWFRNAADVMSASNGQKTLVAVCRSIRFSSCGYSFTEMFARDNVKWIFWVG